MIMSAQLVLSVDQTGCAMKNTSMLSAMGIGIVHTIITALKMDFATTHTND